MKRRLGFVVNSRSGGQQGPALLQALQAMPDAGPVVDVAHRPMPDAVADMADSVDALVACGGDGTVAWALESVRTWADGDPQHYVPVGVMPLGTGNDLARVLAGGEPGRPWEQPEQVVASLQQAPVTSIDRWTVSGPIGERAFYNYCSWGVDAHIASRFDSLRDRHPSWFRTGAMNKAIYVGLGLFGRGKPLSGSVNGKPVPEGTQALVAANITSYAGGGHLGDGVRYDDGCLDLFAFRSLVGLTMQVRGLRPIGPWVRQRQVDVLLPQATAIQVDGEPLKAPPGRYRLRQHGQMQVLAPAATRRRGTRAV